MGKNIASDETHNYRPFCPPAVKDTPIYPIPCQALSPAEKYRVNLRPDFKIYCKVRDYCFKFFGHNYKGKMVHNIAYSDDEISNIYNNGAKSQSLCLLKCEGWSFNGYSK